MKRCLSISLLFICNSLIGQEKVFDTHVHLWHGSQSLMEYLHQLDSTKQTVTRFAGILIARKGEPAITKANNDTLIALSKRHPELWPICSVHPYDGDTAINELKRLAVQGVTIIKIHPHTQDFEVTDSRVSKLCNEAGKVGIMILMDNASIKPGDCEKLFDLAIKCSHTKFIFAHTGLFNFRFWNIIAVAKTAKGFYMDNIYFDVSAAVVYFSRSPIEKEFIWTLRNIGIDHIMLGSDYPQYSLKQAVDAFDRLELSDEEKNKIRFENADKLFVRH